MRLVISSLARRKETAENQYLHNVGTALGTHQCEADPATIYMTHIASTQNIQNYSD